LAASGRISVDLLILGGRNPYLPEESIPFTKDVLASFSLWNRGPSSPQRPWEDMKIISGKISSPAIRLDPGKISFTGDLNLRH
jgi:hypothetical protein